MHLSHHIVTAMMNDRHRGLLQEAANRPRRNRLSTVSRLMRWAKGLGSVGTVPADAFSHRLDLTRDLPALRGYPVGGR